MTDVSSRVAEVAGRPAPAEAAPAQSDSGFAEANPVHGRQDTGCTEPFIHPRHTPSGIDPFSNTKEVYKVRLPSLHGHCLGNTR